MGWNLVISERGICDKDRPVCALALCNELSDPSLECVGKISGDGW